MKNLFLILFFVSCANEESKAPIVQTVDSDQCENGGALVRVGTDENEDGTLSGDEVDSESLICNGANGVSGLNGANGVDGVNGVDGQDGSNGLDGVDGARGPAGPRGQNGTNGTNGVDGQSVLLGCELLPIEVNFLTAGHCASDGALFDALKNKMKTLEKKF